MITLSSSFNLSFESSNLYSFKHGSPYDSVFYDREAVFYYVEVYLFAEKYNGYLLVGFEFAMTHSESLYGYSSWFGSYCVSSDDVNFCS